MVNQKEQSMRGVGIFSLVVGIASIIYGIFRLYPLIWGIPVTILGILWFRKGAVKKGKK